MYLLVTFWPILIRFLRGPLVRRWLVTVPTPVAAADAASTTEDRVEYLVVTTLWAEFLVWGGLLELSESSWWWLFVVVLVEELFVLLLEILLDAVVIFSKLVSSTETTFEESDLCDMMLLLVACAPLFLFPWKIKYSLETKKLASLIEW